MVNSYTALTQALPAWLDVTTADVSSVLSDIVDNAEKRIFREVRTTEMESSLSVTISSGLATIPSDFISLRYAYVNSNPTQYLQNVPISYIYDKYPTRTSAGKPVVMARDGSSWQFAPYPDSNYVIKGSYYATPSTIGTGTSNALIAKYGDLYLYACLVETEPLLGRDQRMPIWESKYRMIRDSINADADKSRLGGNLSVRLGT